MKAFIPNPYASPQGAEDFEKNPDSGVMGMMSFENHDFWLALRKLFACKQNEEITGLVIKNDRLYAKMGNISITIK